MKNHDISKIAMQRSIGLAYLALGKTFPNPLVGSVIMRDNRCIGEGFHPRAGLGHAEVYAVSSAHRPSLPLSHLFVTLEPCSHFGKTPPCTKLIIDSGIPQVTIGSRDIHQKVNGKGIEMLEKNAIIVHESSDTRAFSILNKRFFTFHEKKRPFILLKWAESSDGKIDQNGVTQVISNSLVKQFVHTIRSHEHAIMIGKNTALNDNPLLTTRAITGRNPIRIILDRNLEVPMHYALMNHDAETWIINEVKEQVEGHIRWLQVQDIKNMDEVFALLHQHQIQSVLVEGGSRVLHSCLEKGYWDEAIVIKNQHLTLGSGTPAPPMHARPTLRKQFRDNTVFFYHRANDSSSETESLPL